MWEDKINIFSETTIEFLKVMKSAFKYKTDIPQAFVISTIDFGATGQLHETRRLFLHDIQYNRGPLHEAFLRFHYTSHVRVHRLAFHFKYTRVIFYALVIVQCMYYIYDCVSRRSFDIVERSATRPRSRVTKVTIHDF